MLNPVLRREIQTSLRNKKVFAAVVFYVAALIVVIGCVFWAEFYNSYDFSFDPSVMSGLFAIMAVVQLFLIMIIVPAITGGSISGERERQTFDLLLVSKMKPASIVTGKLFSSIAIVLFMIIASMPVFAITVMFGGIGVTDIVLTVIYFVCSAFCLGSLSILFSALVKKSSVAMVVVYMLLFVAIVGGIVLFSTYSDYKWMVTGQDPSVWVYIFMSALNPLISVVALIDSLISSGIMSTFSFGYSVNYTTIWVLHILFMALASALSILIAAKSISPVKMKNKN